MSFLSKTITIVKFLYQHLAIIRRKTHRRQITELKQKINAAISTYKKEISYWKNRARLTGNSGVEADTSKQSVVSEELCKPDNLKSLYPEIRDKFIESLGEEKTPNPDQWEMILSENPLTYVNAGAGSGKSTTLILRIYILRHYFKVPWETITVFTFTRNSRYDLIGNLIETFKKLGEEITYKIAVHTIRTFHSFACLLHIRSTGKNLKSIFEIRYAEPKTPEANLASAINPDESDEEFDIENTSVLNSSASSREKNDTTINLALKNIYIQAFSNDLVFRDLIIQLYTHSLYQIPAPKSAGPANKDFVKKYDYLSTEFLVDYWTKKNIDFEHIHIDLHTIPVKVSDKTDTYHFNAQIKITGEYILLAIPHQTEIHHISGRFNIGMHINSKLKLLYTESDIPIRIIRTEEELTELNKRLTWLSSTLKKPGEAPSFDYLPQGEMKGGSDIHISNRFFQTIQFIESHSLDADDCIDKFQLLGFTKSDRFFVKATRLFYLHFRDYLEKEELTTFNQLFTSVNSKKMDFVQALSLDARNRLKHLMIDEFQDICPLFADFIKAIKFSLAEDREESGTLMAIGDDYQSIYGWKGSSPEYFTRFEENFPSYNTPKQITMEINYRSSQSIINFAESLLKPISILNMLPKSGISNKDPQGNGPKPHLYLEDKKEFNYGAIKNLIIREARLIGATEDKPILVLTRGKKDSNSIKYMLRGHKNVNIMTYHSSKGLEAKSTILLGDCRYDAKNQIKNDVIRQYKGHTGKGNRYYDSAQRDESFRLAYVAATRGAERIYWILLSSTETSSIINVIRKNESLCVIKKIRGSMPYPTIPIHKRVSQYETI